MQKATANFLLFSSFGYSGERNGDKKISTYLFPFCRCGLVGKFRGLFLGRNYSYSNDSTIEATSGSSKEVREAVSCDEGGHLKEIVFGSCPT